MTGSAAVVGDDEDLGRSGEQVDSDLAEQLPLRLSHVGVAWTGDQVDPADGLGAQRQGGHRLHAAEKVDLVSTGQVHRGDGGGRDLAVDRRRTCRHPRHPRDLGGHDRHVGGGHQRVPAARDVRAGRRDRQVPLAEPDAGQSFDLELPHRVELVPGEVSYPFLHGADVVENLFRHRAHDCFDLFAGKPKRFRRPSVEPLRVLPDGRVALCPDVGDHGCDSRLYVGCLGGTLFSRDRTFELGFHGSPSNGSTRSRATELGARRRDAFSPGQGNGLGKVRGYLADALGQGGSGDPRAAACGHGQFVGQAAVALRREVGDRGRDVRLVRGRTGLQTGID